MQQFLKIISARLTLSLLSLCFFLFFIVVGILTYGPIAGVELHYQYNRVLHQVFHAHDLRSLILPTIHFEIITAQHPEFGIVIPKLYLDEPVLFNIDPRNPDEYKAALKKGIAQAAGTAFPPYAGLGYYFAHSSTPDLRNQYNAVFYLLGKLEKGDEVDLWYQNTKYEYLVTDKVVTQPDDLNFLNKTYPLPTVVLQTCWPPGTTLKRLLIFAERRVRTEINYRNLEKDHQT